MGCDIHLHSEVKIDGVWHHLDSHIIDRNYELFGKMAGVRDEGIEPIINPVGLPEDITILTKHQYKLHMDDAHSESFLSREQSLELLKWMRQQTSFCYRDWYFLYDAEEDGDYDDFRVVFWFDN